MKKSVKNLLSVFGVTSMIFGVGISISSWLNSNYVGFGISIFLVVLGGILLSFAFGD